MDEPKKCVLPATLWMPPCGPGMASSLSPLTRVYIRASERGGQIRRPSNVPFERGDKKWGRDTTSSFKVQSDAARLGGLTRHQIIKSSEVEMRRDRHLDVHAEDVGGSVLHLQKSTIRVYIHAGML